MQIDWLTVSAQIVNFLVLVWLLKRFLYGPLMKAMREREQHIENTLALAAQKEQDAQEEAERYRKDRETIAIQKEAILADMHQEAEKTQRELNDKTKAEVEALRQHWLMDLNAEQGEILAKLRQRITHQIRHTTGRVLADLADTSLETQTIRIFLQRLHALDEAEKRPLIDALSEDKVVIATAFDLPKTLRDEIMKSLTALCNMAPHTRFEHKPELTFGIELIAAQHTISWNIADYLTDIERDMESGLQLNPGMT